MTLSLKSITGFEPPAGAIDKNKGGDASVVIRNWLIFLITNFYMNNNMIINDN